MIIVKSIFTQGCVSALAIIMPSLELLVRRTCNNI
jgi:hypothetical protein